MKRYINKLALLSLAFFLAAPAAFAEDKELPKEPEETLYNCGKHKGKVSVAFKPEIEVEELIAWAMGFTCKNFVYGPGVVGKKGKVTIIAPKKMSQRDAWKLFLTSLETIGLTIVPKGNVLLISEIAKAKNDALPIYAKGTPASAAQMVRMVLRPEHVSVEDLRTALDSIKSKDGIVTALPKAGILVVTDKGDILYRMRTLVREVDSPGTNDGLYMVKVRHADATELAEKLTQLIGTEEKPTTTTSSTRRSSRRGRNTTPAKTTTQSDVNSAIPSKILADERTNTIFIVGGEAAYQRVRALVIRLDVPMDVEGSGRVHVYPLENAVAEELAQTLQAVISGTPQQSSRGNTNTRNTRTPVRAPPPGAGEAAFTGQMSIAHDKATNSLVVVASTKDFLSLRSVIRRLDIPRRQVHIEAVIVEVKHNNALTVGSSFHLGNQQGDGGIIVGGSSSSSLNSLNPASLATLTGGLGGILGEELEVPLLGTSIPSYGLLIQALANTDNINILSAPHLMTVDNTEAEISIGQNIPYLSGRGVSGAAGGLVGQTNTNISSFLNQNIDRKDLSLEMKVTPHVNQSDMVRLDFELKISDLGARDFEGNGPSWSERETKTTVNVRDQQTIVISGLIQEKETTSESKIPLLGDIPILGYLFKNKTKSKEKTNLLVVLTPYIVKDQLDVYEITQDKKREREEFTRALETLRRASGKEDVDYSRKRGLVEEINKAVTEIERERAVIDDLERRLVEYPDGSIEGGTGADANDAGESNVETKTKEGSE